MIETLLIILLAIVIVPVGIGIALGHNICGAKQTDVDAGRSYITYERLQDGQTMVAMRKEVVTFKEAVERGWITEQGECLPN